MYVCNYVMLCYVCMYVSICTYYMFIFLKVYQTEQYTVPSLDTFVPGPGVTARNWSQVREVVEVERFGNSKSSSARCWLIIISFQFFMGISLKKNPEHLRTYGFISHALLG